MKCFWAFSSFAVGGPQRRFVSIADQLGDDYHHIVTAMDECYDVEMLLGERISYTRCPLTVEKNGAISRANIRCFADALEEAEPDLLLTSNWGTIEWRIANRKAKIPHLHFEDGFGPDESAHTRNKKRNLARRILFSRLATGHGQFSFVAPSHTLGDIFEEEWRVPADRTAIIPNGVNIGRFASIEPPGDRSIPVIGSVGALRPEKRFDRLLRVFSKVRQKTRATLLIIGDGPLAGDLRQQARDLNISEDVIFAGAQADVAPFLRRMDVFALTSDTEQMPVSLVEAMAAGLPVVASNVGDIRDILSAENRRFAYYAEDEKNMARAISTMLRDHRCRASLGAANAAKAALEYSLETMTHRYRALFESVAT